MSPRIVPMDRFLLAELVKDERDGLFAEMASGPHVADQVMIAASEGNAFAMIDGAYAVAGAWMSLRWHGCAIARALISRNARKRHVVKMAEFARAHLDRRQRDPAFRRVEVEILEAPGWCATAFATAMGFTELSHLEAYDPAGRNYWLAARVAPRSV